MSKTDARDTTATIESMSNVEIRAVGNVSVSMDGGRPRIDARAIVFDSWSEDLGGFRERMTPGSVQLSNDMVGLFDHDTSMVVGRVSAGTMEVRSDKNGVAFTAYPPDTTWAKDLLVSMKRGDIKGCSFRMMVNEDAWYVDNGQVCRDILSAEISELTITSMPAYPATTAEARSHAQELAVQIPENLEERAGRVISDSNEQLLKSAYAAIELAEDALETVLKQVDPTFMAEDDMCDCGGDGCPGCDCTMDMPDANCQCPDPNCATCNQSSDPSTGGAPAAMDRSVDGASATSKEVLGFAQGFGFITTKKQEK